MKRDMQFVSFHITDVFDDIGDKLWCHDRYVTEVITARTPLKSRKTVKKFIPYMNARYQKACHKISYDPKFII